MNDVPKTTGAGAFDAAAWREQLLALNPWASDLAFDEEDKSFLAARRTATLVRHAQGSDAWNAWASKMLALKENLEQGGKLCDGEGGRTETHTWLAFARSEFSTAANKRTFEGYESFARIVFPADVSFEGATFSAVASFRGATFHTAASFGGAIFSAEASFHRATFSADAWFTDATFSAEAAFDGATFSAAALFSGATFSADASFAGATFSADAWFDGATFSAAWFDGAAFNGAWLDGATFSAAASFGSATFNGAAFLNDVRFGGPVDLSRAKFAGAATLAGSRFAKGASFEALNSDSAFSLADARFRQVPSFIGATFKGALRLDNVATPKYSLLGWTRDKNASAHFRELKRRAVEAQDRDRELEFFAQEIRTARFHAFHRFPWIPRVWSWRFWFGLAYGTLSNFGRSLWRPAFFWLALVAIFAVFYLGQNEEMRARRAVLGPDGLSQTAAAYVTTTRNAWTHRPKCTAEAKVTEGTDPLWEALYLSANLFSLVRADTSRRTYGCLYGFEQQSGPNSQPVPPNSPVIIPYRVAVASALQTILSAILVFLFALAVRNLLRLK